MSRYRQASLTLVIILLVVFPATASESSEALEPHCVGTPYEVDTPEGTASTAPVLDCFATFSDAMYFATSGNVRLAENVGPATVTQEMVDNPTDGILGIDFDDDPADPFFAYNYATNSGGRSVIWRVSDPSGCLTKAYAISDLRNSGWNDRINQAYGFSGCENFIHYEHINFGGLGIPCPACPHMFHFTDKTSSLFFGRLSDPSPDVSPVIPGTELKARIDYLVAPHPDDEISSWALIDNDSNSYPVFMVMTQGELSGYCDIEARRNYEPEYGELPPVPEPFGKSLETCKQARIASWHLFLDTMATVDRHLDVPLPLGTFAMTRPCSQCSREVYQPEPTDVTRVPALEYDLYVGAKSARMVFDFGDLDLRREEIRAAVQEARMHASLGTFGLRQEGRVIGSAYYSKDTDCFFRDHTDHDAVLTEINNIDFGTPGLQYVRTTDCDTTGRPSHTFYVETSYYDAMMSHSNTLLYGRSGVAQRVYGWLRTGAFAKSECDSKTCAEGGSSFSRKQVHAYRF